MPLEEISQVEVLDFPREGERSVPPVEKLVLEFPVSAFGRVAAFFAGSLSAEPAGKGKVRASVHTAWDDALQAWLFSEGPEVRLVAPKKAAEQFRERAKALAKAYKS